MLPDAVSATLPALPAAVVLIKLSTLICLPNTETGPAISIAEARLISWSDVPSAPLALPIVNPVRPEPKLQPAVLNAPLKSSPVGWMRNTPVPAKVLPVGLAALCCNTRVPALIVVVPLYVLFDVNVTAPLAAFTVKSPAPDIKPETVAAVVFTSASRSSAPPVPSTNATPRFCPCTRLNCLPPLSCSSPVPVTFPLPAFKVKTPAPASVMASSIRRSPVTVCSVKLPVA